MTPDHVCTSVYAFAKKNAFVAEALSIIETALTTHGPDAVAISFNGGKDCTVLLHLYLAAHLSVTRQVPLINALYIPLPNEFPSLHQFIQDSTHRYNLKLFTAPPSYSIRTGLELYKASEQGIAVKAILIGTRSTDPDGVGLKTVTQTSGGWPAFERVSPLLSWDYTDIWTFLREPSLKDPADGDIDQPGVPYCDLYDLGYTSLGSTLNTDRNPALLDTGDRYKPAWQLQDGSLERNGRRRA